MAVLRAHAKAVNFSVIYGATGKGPAETAWKNYGLHMTAAEGDAAIARFFEKYPAVKRRMERSLIESTRLGLVRIGCGRVVEARWEKTRQLPEQTREPVVIAVMNVVGLCGGEQDFIDLSAIMYLTKQTPHFV